MNRQYRNAVEISHSPINPSKDFGIRFDYRTSLAVGLTGPYYMFSGVYYVVLGRTSFIFSYGLQVFKIILNMILSMVTLRTGA